MLVGGISDVPSVLKGHDSSFSSGVRITLLYTAFERATCICPSRKGGLSRGTYVFSESRGSRRLSLPTAIGQERRAFSLARAERIRFRLFGEGGALIADRAGRRSVHGGVSTRVHESIRSLKGEQKGCASRSREKKSAKRVPRHASRRLLPRSFRRSAQYTSTFGRPPALGAFC